MLASAEVAEAGFSYGWILFFPATRSRIENRLFQLLAVGWVNQVATLSKALNNFSSADIKGNFIRKNEKIERKLNLPILLLFDSESKFKKKPPGLYSKRLIPRLSLQANLIWRMISPSYLYKAKKHFST